MSDDQLVAVGPGLATDGQTKPPDDELLHADVDTQPSRAEDQPAPGVLTVEQLKSANFYEAALQTFWDEPWFLGYAWWDWPARLYSEEAAGEHRGFCVYGKPAEKVVRGWYAKSR